MTSNRGATLLEIMMVVIILGISSVLLKAGIDYKNQVQRQGIKINNAREVELALYDISRAVRNSKSILTIEPTRLQLTVFDTVGGYDTATNPFFTLAHGTVTYSYESAGNESYLLRRIEYSPTRITERKMLRNIMIAPTVAVPLFEPLVIIEGPPAVYESAPFTTVQVVIQTKAFGAKGKSGLYRTVSSRRSRL